MSGEEELAGRLERELRLAAGVRAYFLVRTGDPDSHARQRLARLMTRISREAHDTEPLGPVPRETPPGSTF